MMRRRGNSAASNAKRRRNEAGKVSHLETDYSGPSFSDLPGNILVTILLKLSVKRILVCKCVCKTWYDLIPDPEFTDTHFEQVEVCPLVRTSGFTSLSRMIYLVQPELDGFECKPKMHKLESDSEHLEYFEVGSKSRIRVDTKLKLPLRNLQVINPGSELERSNHMKLNMKNHKYSIVNSCNGLLLLSNPSDNDPVIVCNPVTGEFINLPEVRAVNDHRFGIACGLGYSPVTKQYIVIRMFSRWSGSNRVMAAEANILGTDSWKHIQSYPESLHMEFTTYLNGCLYWLSTYAPYCVICFDIEKGCFESISPPDILDDFEDVRVSFGVLGGELLISEFSKSVDFWAMKDDGKEKTWSQIFSFHFGETEGWRRGSYQPIKYLNDGAMLMFNPHKCAFICKHPEKRGFRYFKIRGLHEKVEAIAHVPSLVSLNHALLGHNAEVFNITSRCGNLKLHNETKGIYLVEEDQFSKNVDSTDDDHT